MKCEKCGNEIAGLFKKRMYIMKQGSYAGKRVCKDCGIQLVAELGVKCDNCGRAFEATEKYWTDKKTGKRLCQECRVKDLQVSGVQRQAGVERPTTESSGTAFLAHEATMKKLIRAKIQEAESFKKGINFTQLTYAFTDARAATNVMQLRGIDALLGAQLAYNDLILRKLDSIEKALTGGGAETEATAQAAQTQTDQLDCCYHCGAPMPVGEKICKKCGMPQVDKQQSDPDSSTQP